MMGAIYAFCVRFVRTLQQEPAATIRYELCLPADADRVMDVGRSWADFIDAEPRCGCGRRSKTRGSTSSSSGSFYFYGDEARPSLWVV
jgi:hypothetical protein